MKPNHEALARILEIASRTLAPPPKLTVSEWADAERRLSSEASAEPGRWKTDRAPYQRGILDAVNEPSVENIVVMSSAQIGKTELLLNTLGYFVHHDPAPVLCLMPTLEIAESFSKDRLAPMVRDTPGLKDKIKDPRSRDSGNTLLHKRFPGGHVTLAAANSPASLASRPIRICLMDEIDRYGVSAGGEGDPVSLARKRTATFWNRKIIMVSTPTIKNQSRIEAAFEESDKRRFHVPCPACGEFQTLKFSNVKWEKDRPETAWLECEHCHARIDEGQKARILRGGKWIAEAPFKGTAGFHINELYSPWRKWREVVADFLEAKSNPERLRTWVNTSMGETFEIRSDDSPQWRELYDSKREAYPVGTVPNGPLVLLAGADVQRDRVECSVYGFYKREAWLIDHVVLPGDPNKDEVWDDLYRLLNREWLSEDGHSFSIRAMAVDSGYLTTRTYLFAKRRPDKIFAVKGVDGLNLPVGQGKAVDVKIGSKVQKRGVKLWPVGSSVLKRELFGRLKIQKPTDSEMTERGFPPEYVHFPQMNEEFFKQLSSEQLVLKATRFGSRYEFFKTYERNEALDTAVYSFAMFYALGINRWPEDHWNQLNPRMKAKMGKLPARQEPRSDIAPRGVAEVQRRKSTFW